MQTISGINNGRVSITRLQRGGWTISCAQHIPRTPEEVFPFFAQASNLELITPPFLHFKILKISETSLKAGSTIDYTLRLHRIPVLWRTLISEWKPPDRFIDVQRIGPFKGWHHVHEFAPVVGGTEIRDTVTFDLYCSLLANTPLLKWVHSDLQQIFEFRQLKVSELLVDYAASSHQAPSLSTASEGPRISHTIRNHDSKTTP